VRGRDADLVGVFLAEPFDDRFGLPRIVEEAADVAAAPREPELDSGVPRRRPVDVRERGGELDARESLQSVDQVSGTLGDGGDRRGKRAGREDGSQPSDEIRDLGERFVPPGRRVRAGPEGVVGEVDGCRTPGRLAWVSA